MIPAALVSILAYAALTSATSTPVRRPDIEAVGPTSAGHVTVWRRHLTRVTAAIVVAIVFGPVALVVGVLLRWMWPRARSIVQQRRSKAAVERALPDAIEMLVLVVHAGMTPHQAVVLLEERAPGPIRPGFEEVRRRVRRGAALADALRALPDVLGPSASIVADTLALAERHGTPIGEALEQLSHDVRERRRRTAEADARKLPIRMSFPLVACTLPSFVLVAIVPAVLAALSSLSF